MTGVMVAVGFLLTIQLSSQQSGTQSLSSYVDLKTQIAEQLQEQKMLEAQVAKARAQVVQYQSAKGHRVATLQALKQDAAAVQREAGLKSISGPGIEISIYYDPTLPYDAQTAGLFEANADQELGLIVNDLYANGATAISINGQRLVTTSSIRLVTGLNGDSTLQVNAIPVVEPYVISAVGDIQRMKAILTVDNVATQLNLMQEQCVITPYPGEKGVTVPPYKGPLPGQFAKEVQGK